MEGQIISGTAGEGSPPDVFDRISRGFFNFSRHVSGMVSAPYQSMRRVVDRSYYWEIVFVFVFIAVYFGLVSLVRVSSFRPFLLTRHFLLLIFSAGLTFLFSTGLVFTVGKWLGGRGSFWRVFSGWAYTMTPTVLWFFLTSLVSFFLPPPRTASALGILFSVCFLFISAVLFYWKLMLGYLAVRFSLRLDLLRILGVFLAYAFVMSLYSILMYKLGIYRVPFL
jgi:hypothetical protein